MALYKVVDGVRMEMTPEEESRIQAEWAANAAAPRLDPFDSWVAGNPQAVAVLERIALAAGLDFEKVKSDAQRLL